MDTFCMWCAICSVEQGGRRMRSRLARINIISVWNKLRSMWINIVCGVTTAMVAVAAFTTRFHGKHVRTRSVSEKGTAAHACAYNRLAHALGCNQGDPHNENSARQSGIVNHSKHWSCEASVRTLSGHGDGQRGQKVVSAATAGFIKCYQETCYVIDFTKNSAFLSAVRMRGRSGDRTIVPAPYQVNRAVRGCYVSVSDRGDAEIDNRILSDLGTDSPRRN
jgi:hypothetical protein